MTVPTEVQLLTTQIATAQQAEKVVRWLRREYLSDPYGGGFYHQRTMIREAARDGELACFMARERPLGYAVFRIFEDRGQINLFEVRSRLRGRGLGSMMARQMIELMTRRGARVISLQCTPGTSERFWRRIGFTDDHSWQVCSENLRLRLELPGTVRPVPAPDAAASAASQSSESPDR